MTKRKLIVPFIFNMEDYEKEDPAYTWLFYKFSELSIKGNYPIIVQDYCFRKVTAQMKKDYEYLSKIMDFNFPKEEEIEKHKKYMIKSSEMDLIMNKYPTREAAIEALIKNRDEDFENMLITRLDEIEKDYDAKIEALCIWVGMESIYHIAKERNIKVILMEISAVRRPTYNMTLGYFSFKDKYDLRNTKEEYEKFLGEYKNKKVPILSREELLALFLSWEELDCLKRIHDPKIEEFELGISPGLKKDFFFDLFSNEKIEDTMKKATKLFKPEKISVRFHPSHKWDLETKKLNIDDSRNSFFWIQKCRRIVTSVSNVAFEAMLLGKTAYVLSEYMPYSFMTANELDYIEDGIVDIKFLNYMLFAYYAPWSLMFDEEYIKYRLTCPSPLEIYKYNFDYIMKEKNLKKPYSLTKILQTVHNLPEEKLEELTNNNTHDLYKKLTDAHQQEITNKDTRIKELEESNNFYQTELNNVLNSKSWKMTTPLRKVTTMIKNK